MKLPEFLRNTARRNLFYAFLIFGFILVLTVCSGGGGDGGGTTGDTSGSNGGDTTGDTSNMLMVSGSVTNLVSGVTTGTAQAALSGVSVVADYVYAVDTDPEWGSEWRKKSAIQADGTFSISLTKGKPWILAFIDTSKTGSAMIQGIFRAQELDSISPDANDSAASTNLGAMTIDDSGAAELPAEQYETFVGNLGMTLTQAATLGSLDDLMLRYVNPDIDNNGLLDMDEANFPEFNLGTGQSYRYGDGTTIEFIRSGSELPPEAVVSPQFINDAFAGIDLWVVQSDWSIFSTCPGKWSLEWIDGDGNDNVTVPNPYMVTDCVYPASPPAEKHFGVGFPLGVNNIPDGTYIYNFYTNSGDTIPQKTLTFTNVKTFSDASDFTNLVVPFLTFNTDVNGDITSVDYTWMKKTETGFVVATVDDINLIVGRRGANMDWRCADSSCGGWYNSFVTTSSTGSFNIADAETFGLTSQKRANIDVISIFLNTRLGNNYIFRICADDVICLN